MSISAVQYASGLRLELPRLGEGCEKRGVLLCIDAIQQLGALPFDVQQSRCAFAMADGHKWMLGPEGLAVFYCRSDLREALTLHEFGWHMLEHAGDYDRQEWEPARSARRFECGSPNMLGAMGLEASLSLLEEVGMREVAIALQQRVTALSDELAAMPGVRLLSPNDPARRAGIVTFSIDGLQNQTLFEGLKAEQIVCALRGGGVRLSPHFYTPPAILEDTLAVIRGLAQR
jgi:selenocysteine lyase/cysteine desulfurase